MADAPFQTSDPFHSLNSHAGALSSRSTSSSSITPRTTVRLSIKPFTATRSILLVVALYSVRRIVFSSDKTRVSSLFGFADVGEIVEKERRTRGDSSLSTCRARCAEVARRAVGRGISMTLEDWSQTVPGMWREARTNLQRARKLRVNSRSHLA
jgi:hypothetical protein